MPGACRWVMYQMQGKPYSRCISLASSGLPEAVWAPDRAQPLEPGGGSPALRAGNKKSTLCGSPWASISRFIKSSRQEALRVRYMCRQIKSESTTLQGRGW